MKFYHSILLILVFVITSLPIFGQINKGGLPSDKPEDEMIEIRKVENRLGAWLGDFRNDWKKCYNGPMGAKDILELHQLLVVTYHISPPVLKTTNKDDKEAVKENVETKAENSNPTCNETPKSNTDENYDCVFQNIIHNVALLKIIKSDGFKLYLFDKGIDYQKQEQIIEYFKKFVEPK